MKRLLFIALLVVFACEDEQDTISSVPPCSLDDVYINEAHGDGDPEDWVEIYNAGSLECALAGFTMDDEFPTADLTFGSVNLMAGGYWLGEKDSEGSFTSGIDKSGDILYFCVPGATDETDCQVFEVGTTEGLTAWGYPNNDRSQSAGNLTESTPGSANTD